jgi:hypothetical protein
MKPSVLVEGYTKHLNVVAFIKLIREATGGGLALTKGRVDGLLEGKPFRLAFGSQLSADYFSEAATNLGAIVRKPCEDASA